MISVIGEKDLFFLYRCVLHSAAQHAVQYGLGTRLHARAVLVPDLTSPRESGTETKWRRRRSIAR